MACCRGLLEWTAVAVAVDAADVACMGGVSGVCGGGDGG